jgi:hypothetical protein
VVRTAGTPATGMVVVENGTEMIVGSLPAGGPDLALIDALARLQLDARRLGWTVRLRDAPDELRALIELTGLGGVLPLEARREAEGGEEPRVDEVVQPDDPLA